MCSNDDDSQLKLVDFGLSKMIGPNETTNDPFGTLVRIKTMLKVYILFLQSYVAPEVLM